MTIHCLHPICTFPHHALAQCLSTNAALVSCGTQGSDGGEASAGDDGDSLSAEAKQLLDQKGSVVFEGETQVPGRKGSHAADSMQPPRLLCTTLHRHTVLLPAAWGFVAMR